MSFEPEAIRVSALSKRYHLYNKPADWLWRFFAVALERWTGLVTAPRSREFHALRGVSMTIRKGETVGIIGRNGSGKSTLLQLICGTLHPSQGQVTVEGRVAALLELGSGFNPEFTGRENVFLNASVLGLSRHETQSRFDAISTFADIGDFIDQPLKTYSSGMALRLAFAVIAHVDADILVIDEALAVGDAIFTQKCMRFLRAFMARGTVLIVSHDIEGVKALCERVVWLDKGLVLRDGPTREVCEDYLDALFRNVQGQDRAVFQPSLQKPDFTLPLRDPRLELLNASTLRNDLQLFKFDPAAPGFGTGGASIREVRLLDDGHRQLTWAIGGELVELEIIAQCHIPLASPIIGFMVKDRTGQALFGDNTWLLPESDRVTVVAGGWIKASFLFEMPRLPPGDYSTVVAIVDGTQELGVHHHWVHDALPFRSTSSSVASGLVGIPMRRVALSTFTP